MSIFNKIGSWIKNTAVPAVRSVWKDFTGQTAVDMQNQANLNLAKYQTQVQEELYNKYSSPESLMKQFQDSGLNPNLVYGSAASGQGNVPSFQAPHMERYMSGAQMFNTALSALSSIQGIQTARYNVQAAREAAEQSALKTLNDMLNYRRNARDYELENQVSGYQEMTPIRRMFRKLRGNVNVEGLFDGSPNPQLDKYIGASRDKFFAEAARPGVQNRRDNAAAYVDEVTGNYLPEYLHIRNQQAQLNYDIDNDFKKATAFGNAAGPFLQFLSGIIRKFVK